MGTDTLSLVGLAQALGRGENTIRRYILAGLPVVSKGDRGKPWRFDLAACQEWLAARAQGAKEPQEITRERVRLLKIQAGLKELELQRRRGELIRTDLAQKLWAAVMHNVVSKIDAIPAKLPPLVHGLPIPEIKALTEKMVHEVKNEIANPDLRVVAGQINAKKTKVKGKKKHGKRAKN